MQLRPLTDKILVEFIEDNMTKSWIILTTNWKERPVKWTIISIPRAKTFVMDWVSITMDVEPGQIVYFSRHSWDEVEINGKKLLALRYNSILAVEEEDEEKKDIEKA